MRYPAQTKSKRCPIPGCSIRCHPAYVMCVEHWRMVAKPMQDAVWSNYKLAPGSAAHLAACQAAIRSATQMAAVLPASLPARGSKLNVQASMFLAATALTLALAFSLTAAAPSIPPLPPLKKKPLRASASSLTTKGAGAFALITKAAVIAPPALRTNTFPWRYPAAINPGNLWWNLETTTNLRTWSVIVSNATGDFTLTNNKTPGLRAYRLVGRANP